jgi:lipopolysaccharide export system permease protein
MVTFTLAGIFSFMVLSDQLSDVGKGYYSAGHAVLFVVLTLPGRMIEFAPMSGVIATILTMENMIRYRELIALKTSGVVNKYFINLFIKISVFFAIIILLFLQFITPLLDQYAHKLKAAAVTSNENLLLGKEGFWAKEGNYLININEIRPGNVIRAIAIYEYSLESGLKAIINAETGSIINRKVIILDNVHEKRFTSEGIKIFFYNKKTIAFNVPLFHKEAISVPVESASLTELISEAKTLKKRGENYDYTMSVFWQKVSIPLVVMAIILLCLPFFINRIPTRAELSQEIAFSILGGTLIYFLKYILGYVAVVFQMNSFLLLMTPIALIFIVDVYLLRKVRE